MSDSFCFCIAVSARRDHFLPSCPEPVLEDRLCGIPRE